MTTTAVRERESMPMTHEPFSRTNVNGKDYYTVEEFMDKLAKKLGQRYGLNDIREAV